MSRGATGSPGRPERGGVWGAISGPPILIGLDVGGTTIAAGAVTPDGEVLLDERVATRDAKAVGTPAAIEALVERVRAAVAARGLTVAGIGVGVPGPVDAEAGVVGDPAPHAPDLVDVPLAQRLAARFGIPAFVDNDVNALALGEWRFGAGRGARSLVVLAAGTGFGGGVILDGRLVRGVTGCVAGSLAALEKRILAAAAEHAFARALAATRITIVPGDKRLTMRGAAALVLYERARRAA